MRSLEILEKLIAFPTVSHDSNLALVDWVEALLRASGFDVTRIWSPNRTKAGLYARIGPATGRGICLSAHSDVVPTDGQDWTCPPFQLTRKGDRLHGRGTTDMKGFLSSALALAERATAANLSEPLSIVLSYDEEIGCVGIREMLPEIKPLLGTPRAVIVGEPTSMQPAIGHKGKAALRVTCQGQAGHSALAPQFVNAIHVAADFINGIRDLQEKLANEARDDAYAIPYSTVHVGRIEGGRALNIVPDEVRLDMEFRHLAETPAADLLQRIKDLATRITHHFGKGANILLDEINAYPGLNTPASSEVAKWASALVQSQSPTKVAFGTEAGFFAELGLPTIVIGPGDMGQDGHKPDEGLDIAQLQACDAMMCSILDDLCWSKQT